MKNILYIYYKNYIYYLIKIFKSITFNKKFHLMILINYF